MPHVILLLENYSSPPYVSILDFIWDKNYQLLFCGYILVSMLFLIS